MARVFYQVQAGRYYGSYIAYGSASPHPSDHARFVSSVRHYGRRFRVAGPPKIKVEYDPLYGGSWVVRATFE